MPHTDRPGTPKVNTRSDPLPGFRRSPVDPMAVVVDEHLERRASQSFQVELRDRVLDVPLGLPVSSDDAAHLVMRGAPDVLAKEKALETPLAPFVGVEPVVVEQPEVC